MVSNSSSLKLLPFGTWNIVLELSMCAVIGFLMNQKPSPTINSKFPSDLEHYHCAKKATIHWRSDDNQGVRSSVPVISRWLWPGNETFLEEASMVTWWVVASLRSVQSMVPAFACIRLLVNSVHHVALMSFIGSCKLLYWWLAGGYDLGMGLF